MKTIITGIVPTLLCSLISATALAELPAYDQQRAEVAIMASDDFAMSDAVRRVTQQKLANAVFLLFAHQPPKHELAENGLDFDGACVAIPPKYLQEIIQTDDIVEEDTPEPAQKSHSFFDRGLDKVSSPFAERESSDKTVRSARQYYLTTADWLTWSDSFEIELYGKRVKAKLEYRDNAQNVAVLSTPKDTRIAPVEIADVKAPIPSTVLLLLSPHTAYESLTLHQFHVEEMHQYGTANFTARNGYPIFSSRGELVGLTVGPNTARTRADIVHPGLLDRTLYPQKYNRTKVEKLELKTY